MYKFLEIFLKRLSCKIFGELLPDIKSKSLSNLKGFFKASSKMFRKLDWSELNQEKPYKMPMKVDKSTKDYIRLSELAQRLGPLTAQALLFNLKAGLREKKSKDSKDRQWALKFAENVRKYGKNYWEED